MFYIGWVFLCNGVRTNAVHPIMQGHLQIIKLLLAHGTPAPKKLYFTPRFSSTSNNCMTRFFKTVLCALLLIISNNVTAQTIISINSCDTTITEPFALFTENTDYTITVNAAAGSRLGFNVEYYSSYYGDVYISLKKVSQY